jgi:membrane protein implicated in regulation of membrane protease activity
MAGADGRAPLSFPGGLREKKEEKKEGREREARVILVVEVIRRYKLVVSVGGEIWTAGAGRSGRQRSQRATK